MASQLIGGAVIGIVFGEVQNIMKEFVKSAREFKPVLVQFQATLDSLEPFIVEIMRPGSEQILSQELARQLLDILNEIKPVVEKCKDNNFSIWEKAMYASKLRNLEKKLRGFFELNGVAKLLVDTAGIMKLLSNPKPLSSPELPDHEIVELEKPIEDLKKMVLFDEDDSCGPVVITGLPGSGKTTLATMLYYDLEIIEKFGNNIFSVTVSSKPDLETLKKVAKMIKETKEVHHTLLVLDDVWPKNEEDIIKLFVFKKPGYKILVTSRYSFPTLDRSRVYELQNLSDKDAEAVFRDAAKPDPELKVDDLIKTIVNSCGASPLVLKEIGRSLNRPHRFSWMSKIRNWSEGGCISDSKDVRDVVKTSLDSLDEDGLSNEKECFLDLVSFPKDQRILATALRDIWVEKYGHDEEGATTLHRLYMLSTRNLIKFKLPSKDVFEIEGSSNDHYVRQHDLLRDLALHCNSQDPIEERSRLIANIQGNEFPRWWPEEKNLDKAELVSISIDEAFSSTWKDLHALNVKVLVLNSRKDYSLPSFLNKMNHLKVIVITNYGVHHAELRNTPVLTMLNLTRIWFENIYITSIPKMAKLKKLSFIRCTFSDFFVYYNNDMVSILPNLVEFEIDQASRLRKFYSPMPRKLKLPKGLCDITGLKRLGITYCTQTQVELPKELGKLINLEVLRLHSCTKLKKLPDSLCDLRNLKHLDITDCYAMKELPERMGKLGKLESLHMKCCGKLWGSIALPTSLNNLKSLKKVICSEQTAHEWRKVEGLTISIVVPEEGSF